MLDSDGPDPPTDAPDRRLDRRSPVGRSESGLASRDYQPRTGGPELVASWPLGPPPSQTRLGDDEWEVTETTYATVQKQWLTLPYLGGVDDVPCYLHVRGLARTTPGATLDVHLRPTHLRGDHYRTTVRLSPGPDGDHFQTPHVEVTPEDPSAYREDVYAGYELRARVETGTGYLDQGTAVALYSE